MKKIILGFIGALFVGGAFAANITLYYSPTCPHCHHAREFISNNLVYEYPELQVTAVNVMQEQNRDEFMDTLKKCEYTSGGVPVLVIGEKCFQGYGDFMANDLRTAIGADLSDEQKSVAMANKAAMDKDADAFRAQHTERANVIVERVTTDAQKKIDKSDDGWVFYAILIVLVVGLGALFGRKSNKK